MNSDGATFQREIIRRLKALASVAASASVAALASGAALASVAALAYGAALASVAASARGANANSANSTTCAPAEGLAHATALHTFSASRMTV